MLRRVALVVLEHGCLCTACHAFLPRHTASCARRADTAALCLGDEAPAGWLPLPSYLPAAKCHDSTPQPAGAADAAPPQPWELPWTWLANEKVGHGSYSVKTFAG